jgi:hypothetical protein
VIAATIVNRSTTSLVVSLVNGRLLAEDYATREPVVLTQEEIETAQASILYERARLAEMSRALHDDSPRGPMVYAERGWAE